MGLVEAGWGLTVIPQLTLAGLSVERQRAHARPFTAPVPVREVSLVRARADRRRNVADRLAECIIAQVSAALGTQCNVDYILSPTPEAGINC